MSEQRDQPPHNSDLSRHILPTSAAMVAALLILAGCETLPRQFDAITHPPIPSSYDWRRDAAVWMKKAFNDPHLCGL